MVINSFVYSQGMPIDNNTGKVCYKGIIELPNVSQKEILDRTAYFLSGYSYFRGSVTALYVNSEKALVRCLLNINITESLKSTLNYVNAAVQINIDEGRCSYSITNLFIVSSTAAMIYENDNKDTPIEASKNFDIIDFDKKNNNAKNTNKHIIGFIDALKVYLLNPTNN